MASSSVSSTLGSYLKVEVKGTNEICKDCGGSDNQGKNVNAMVLQVAKQPLMLQKRFPV